MRRILDVVGLFVGSWLGWAIGAPISVFTAFIVSVVGAGVGLWAVRRFTAGMG